MRNHENIPLREVVLHKLSEHLRKQEDFVFYIFKANIENKIWQDRRVGVSFSI
jgi:hypothetical protein